MKSQADNILKFMKAGRTITPIQALNLFGCFRLGARICDLKKRGVHIEKVMREGRTIRQRFAEYYIPEYYV